MSRIGKKPVFLVSGVDVEINGQQVTVKGPKGSLSFVVHPHATVKVEEVEGVKALVTTVSDPEREDRAVWGTVRALLANMVEGVTKGFSKTLELNGVGFKMALKGDTLAFALGFSHEVTYPVPAGIEIKIENNLLTVSGIDAQLVGRVAADVRALKKPEPYKGKGFRYTDEIIRRKAGKAAKGDK
jgi:large subunit ribosomal protein L6